MIPKIRFPKIITFFLLFLGILYSSMGCQTEGKGFALPEGSAIKGKALFMDLYCNECHSIVDIKWSGNAKKIHFELGGNVRFQKSYGELVASVINPSHKIAKKYYGQPTADEKGISKMKNYNEVMTVQELIDLVTFLQSEYQVERPVVHYPIY